MSREVTSPPKAPPNRIINEIGHVPCPECGSSMMRKRWIFWGPRPGCEQEECRNYGGVRPVNRRGPPPKGPRPTPSPAPPHSWMSPETQRLMLEVSNSSRALRAKSIADKLYEAPLKIWYTNWRGIREVRLILPISVRYGTSQWHPKPQWLLSAYDLKDDELKEFAMIGFNEEAV